jgi:hypothetical protein
VVSSQVAEEALLSVFVTRSEIFEAVEFGGEFHKFTCRARG